MQHPPSQVPTMRLLHQIGIAAPLPAHDWIVKVIVCVARCLRWPQPEPRHPEAAQPPRHTARRSGRRRRRAPRHRGFTPSLDVSLSARARLTRPLPVSATEPAGSALRARRPTIDAVGRGRIGRTQQAGGGGHDRRGRGRPGDRGGAAARGGRQDVDPGGGKEHGRAVVGRRRERVGMVGGGDADDPTVAGGERARPMTRRCRSRRRRPRRGPRRSRSRPGGRSSSPGC